MNLSAFIAGFATGALAFVILLIVTHRVRIAWFRWRDTRKAARHRANIYRDVVRRVK